MTARPFHLLTLILILAFASCNKATPSGFWKNFKKDLLIKDIIDQGPYGGHRAVYWKSNGANTFNSEEVIDFAINNGWTIVDSTKFNLSQTSNWLYDNKPIFPLSYTGLSDTAKSVSTYEYFPRWFGGDIMVYRFKSGWIAIQPGTDNSIEENGFVVFNRERNQMAVYHLWGE
jgi:hypothetical protein